MLKLLKIVKWLVLWPTIIYSAIFSSYFRHCWQKPDRVNFIEGIKCRLAWKYCETSGSSCLLEMVQDNVYTYYWT